MSNNLCFIVVIQKTLNLQELQELLVLLKVKVHSVRTPQPYLHILRLDGGKLQANPLKYVKSAGFPLHYITPHAVEIRTYKIS